MKLYELCRFCVLLGVLLLSTMPTSRAAAPGDQDPLDWPNWRGPEQNRISRETGLVDTWDWATGENVIWKNPALGTISTPIVMRGKLYTLCRSEPGTHQEGEKVVCADAATGKILWENKFNVFLSDVPDTRVAWSNVVGDPTTGRIFAQGVCGYFQCLDGETGKTIWSRSLSEEFGALNTYGGRTNNPIVFEDLVIISAVMTNWGKTSPPLAPGATPPTPTPADSYLAFDPRTGGKGDMARPAHRFLAMDKSTGQVVWFNGTQIGPKDTTYSTPMIAPIGGQMLMVFSSGDGNIYAMQPRTGKIIWKYELSRKGMNVPPLIVGDKVYSSQSEENVDDGSGAVVALNGLGQGNITKTHELWRVKEVMVGRAMPLLVDNRLYTVDDSASLYVFDPLTGEMIGRKNKLAGTIVHASPLYADGKIYACSRSAWHVFEPTEQGVKVLHRLRFPEGENVEEIIGSPIVSHGRIYLPTTGAIYCIGKKDAKPAATERPPQPRESSVSEDEKPAHLQVVPAEILLKPGEQQQFVARLFNARGQFLKEAPAKFAVDGPGRIDDKGHFTADAGSGQSLATVSATLGSMTGFSRVRIVPPLPWKFDFSDGQVPITWVGARYRHQIREVDGEKVMVKINTIPLGTRSQSWMGHTDLHDFTIQADVQGGIKNGKMPDIGLIGQRYTLDMQGINQKLQIRSWTAQLEHRFAVTIPFIWKDGVWYTMKFRTAVENGKAVLKGKVWERGKSEPAAWTIEGTDHVPNVTGSPGLFGNANDAEIFIDNITVTKNS